MIKQFVMALALVSAGLTLNPSDTEACSCMEPTVETSYHQNTDVLKVKIKFTFVRGSSRYYFGKVRKNFKGCIERRSWVILKTAVSSATCGATYEVGRSYLINANPESSWWGIPILGVHSCNYDVRFSELTDEDRDFLNSRYNCCGDECACNDGSEPVDCFADPCEQESCPDGECVANYCGGCNAEFFNEVGELVCTDECLSDEDCSEDTWCRSTEAGTLACTPYVGEEESCGGFTLPWMYERCDPAFVCDTPEYIADAPGICRRPCDGNDDCRDAQYCASDDLCHRDASCDRDVDCNLDGNDYAHIRCLGYGVCTPGNSCGWECGHPGCVDLTGMDFGMCDMVLGWARVGDSCQHFSGCGTLGFTFFETEDECNAMCAQ